MPKPWVFIFGGTGSSPGTMEDLQGSIQNLNTLKEEKKKEEAVLAGLLKTKTQMMERYPEDPDKAKIFDAPISVSKIKIHNFDANLYNLSIRSPYKIFQPLYEMGAKVVRVKGAYRPRESESTRAQVKHTYDAITARSEHKRIRECMEQLRQLNQDEFPERIVLNGHSRGASSCIELARAIYLEFGEPPKVAIHIMDPVPGFGRHDKTKMMIPPSVDSLMIDYFAADNTTIFGTQDLREIFFDPSKTTVTTKVYPTDHNLYTDEGIDCLFEIRNDNLNLWNALTGKELKIDADFESVSDNTLKGVWVRKGHVFSVTSNTEQNKELSEGLRVLHNTLRTKMKGIDDENYSARIVPTNITATNATNPEQRQVILDEIYRHGKRAVDSRSHKEYAGDQKNQNLDGDFKRAHEVLNNCLKHYEGHSGYLHRGIKRVMNNMQNNSYASIKEVIEDLEMINGKHKQAQRFFSDNTLAKEINGLRKEFNIGAKVKTTVEKKIEPR